MYKPSKHVRNVSILPLGLARIESLGSVYMEEVTYSQTSIKRAPYIKRTVPKVPN